MSLIKLFFKRISRYGDASVKEVNKEEVIQTTKTIKSVDDLKGQIFDKYV